MSQKNEYPTIAPGFASAVIIFRTGYESMIDLQTEMLLSVKDARAMLRGVARATIVRWIASGRLESLKIGGRRFTSREALARMAEHGPTGQLLRRIRNDCAVTSAVNTELDDLLGLDGEQ